MTPNDHRPVKDSIQLQTAARMFLEYLLEHQELLQRVRQQHPARTGEGTLSPPSNGPAEQTTRGVRDRRG